MSLKNDKVARTVYLTKEMDLLLKQRAKITLRTVSCEIESLIRRGLKAQQDSDIEAANLPHKSKGIQVTLETGEN